MKIPFNVKIVLPFVFGFLWFSYYLFPSYEAEMYALTKKEIKILDVRPSYGVEEVKTLMSDLKPEGRALYKEVVGFWDMIYPLVYGPMLAIMIFNILGMFKVKRKLWYALTIIPVLAMLFDYLENFNTLSLLTNYDSIAPKAVEYGAMMTSLKWCFVLSSIALVIVIGIGGIWRRLRE